MEMGTQTGKVLGAWVNSNEKGNVSLKVKFELAGGEKVYSSIFVDGPNANEQSHRISRASIKKLGFDIDQFDLEEIATNEHLLDDTEVEIDVSKEEYEGKEVLRVEIRTDAPKPPKAVMAKATAALRKMKSKAEKDEDQEMADKAPY